MTITTEMHLKGAEEKEGYRFNYKGMHRYLITLLTYGSKPVFVEKADVLKVLTVLREVCWKHHFDVYAYCFLPDRLVMIIRGKTEYSDMKAFLAAFRASSSGLFHEQLGHTVWKRKYQERVLRKKEDTKRIAEEVYQLPVKHGLTATAGEYQFKGSFVVDARKVT